MTRWSAASRRRTADIIHVVGGSWIIIGMALGGAAVLDCTDGARVAVPLGVVGGIAIVAGFGLRRRFDAPVVVAPATVLSAMLVVFVLAVAWSVAAYLVADGFESVHDAVFESAAGFSTTALSALDHPERASRGVLAWRSLTQWLGGLGAVISLVGLLPELGIGAPEPGGSSTHDRPWRRTNRRLRTLLHRLAATYAALTVVGVALLAVAGLGPYDAFSVALTTVSTGGFSDHRGSIAFFDSATVEWVVIGGMAVAGAGLALLWRGLTGTVTGVLRSAELRAYLGLLTVATVVVTLGTRPAGGLTHESVRQAVFSVVSVGSTTGHTVTDWTTWTFGPQMVLLGVMAVGAMSGSAGGGFRVLRAMTMVGVVRREIGRQLDPRRMLVVKVGRRAVSEPIIARMVAFQILSTFLVTMGAVLLAVSGVDLVGAVTAAVSALSTVGPAMGDLGPGQSAAVHPFGTQLALVVLMVAGRLEIYPVARAAAGVADGTRRVLDGIGIRR